LDLHLPNPNPFISSDFALIDVRTPLIFSALMKTLAE